MTAPSLARAFERSLPCSSDPPNVSKKNLQNVLYGQSEIWYNDLMTKTQTQYKFIRDGDAYSGAPLYRVETPSGEVLGHVAAGGKRSTVWAALAPRATRSSSGFQSRESAAKYLDELPRGQQ